MTLLMDTDTENGKITVNRVIDNWEKLNQENSLEYEIQNLTGNALEEEKK